MGELLQQIGGWLAIIAGIIGSGGVIYKFIAKPASKLLKRAISEAVQPVVDRQDKTEQHLQAIRLELCENNLQTARVDLCQAINHAPQEHKAILDLAWHYFIDLQGDAWMSGEFRKWAKKEGVDISHIASRVEHLSDK